VIEWYSDDDVKIEFDIVPDVTIRYATPRSTKEETKQINKKPFINKKNLNVRLTDKIEGIVYEFEVPEDYTWDGASVPRFFWRIIGAKTDPRFLIPSMIHDVLCENHDYVDNDRYFATIVFERLLYVSKVNPLARWTVKHSVDNFQKFCRWN
jgi:hypothetical protein